MRLPSRISDAHSRENWYLSYAELLKGLGKNNLKLLGLK